jgi:hypothetical protein
MMDKDKFIILFKDYKTQLQTIRKECGDTKGNQIQSRSILSRIEEVSSQWFSSIEPDLQISYQLKKEIITVYRDLFSKLLKLVEGRQAKNSVISILDTILASFHSDLLVFVQTHVGNFANYPILDAMLLHCTGLEKDYLMEAVECAKAEKYRASVVLGWCAAVSRMHLVVEKIGFDKFNKASTDMSAITSGRYKRFTKKFDIHNRTELNMSVFDTDLIWVLEYLKCLDGNEHERLATCFVMRNTCAHPGEAITTSVNVLSFFSDLDRLIFDNPKFAI